MIAETSPAPDPGTVIERLPVFPLPSVVFFPNTLLPLHVFEDRYRRMIEALPKESPLIGVTLLQGDWRSDYTGAPDFAPVMGMGEVVHCERKDDGCYDILVRGVARVRSLEEVPSGDLFRTVRAEVLGEVVGRDDDPELVRSLVTLRHFFATILSRVPGVDISQASRLFEPSVPAGQVVDSIASALPVSPEDKQALLEELSPADRAVRLSEVLAEMLTRDFPDPAGGSANAPEA